MRLYYIPLFLSASARAVTLFERLSFGHLLPISPDGTTLPNWTIVGSDPEPEIYSDRMALTPGFDGNKRGGLWGNEPLNSMTWDVNVEFRASGPERGGGNFQVWLLKERGPGTELASVYTAEKFDGLALIVDQYGGQGGSIRGFLNDGSVNYRARQNIDGMAFGHCYYAYRNLGLMSRLRVQQSDVAFQVWVDDDLCFRSETLRIPQGYHFGITAASAENPDSFEVGKFVVTDGIPDAPTLVDPNVKLDVGAMPPKPRDPSDPLPLPKGPPPRRDVPPPPPVDPPVEEASSTDAASSSSLDQGMANEILVQLQWLADKIDYLHNEVQSIEKRLTDRQDEIKNGMAIPAGFPTTPTDQMNFMARRIEHIEGMVMQVQKDIEGRDYMDHLTSLHDTLEKTQSYLGESLHENMTKIVHSSAPKLGWFLFLIIASQVMLAVGYVVYKRKRSKSPNKLL